MITVHIDGDGIVTGHEDAKRPPGAGGSQGDHTTPFTVLQNQVFNAIELSKVNDAWDSLYQTYVSYQSLPGWSTTPKTEFDHYTAALEAKFRSRKTHDLHEAVNQMLMLRNVIGYTSIKKGGHGNAEGKWAGSLHYQERVLQLKNPLNGVKKADVIEYMWKAFEHGRLNAMKSADKKTAVLTQHAQTIVDAYPLLSQTLKITPKDVLDAYGTRDWPNYAPVV